MRRILIGICVAAVFTPAIEASAQKLHAILVADTLSGSLKPGVAENLQNMRNFLSSVEIVGEISVSKVEVKDAEFKCKSILEAVADLRVGPDDAVLFYYAGHGFRNNETKSEFPEFLCPRSTKEPKADLDTIKNQILQIKRPRFLLAIADACNILVKPSAPPSPQLAPPPIEERKAALRQLFMASAGSLTMSGSIPDQESWYMVEGDTLGGFFTIQFLRSVNEKISELGSRVRWQDIAPEATKLIEVPTDPTTKQQPQFELIGVQLQ